MYEFDDLIKNLPGAYRKDQWVNDLFNAVTSKDDFIRENAMEVAVQILLDSMTYQLPVDESIAGIRADLDDTIKNRKNALAAKWRSIIGKCDIQTIRQVCATWQGESSAEYDGVEAAVSVRFAQDHDGDFAGLLDSLYTTLRSVIPAHLMMFFETQAPEVKTTVHVGVAQCSGYSRVTLPQLEPYRKACSTVPVGASGGLSHSRVQI